MVYSAVEATLLMVSSSSGDMVWHCQCVIQSPLLALWASVCGQRTTPGYERAAAISS